VKGLDTNVLVRYVMDDDEAQADLATRTLQGLTPTEPGFISIAALAELNWVLRRSYQVSRAEVAALIRELSAADEVVLQDSEAVREALTSVAGGLDFSDALIAAAGKGAGCTTTITFDRQAARHDGFELLA
jgi:predicted nucleic-acid-binding protein